MAATEVMMAVEDEEREGEGEGEGEGSVVGLPSMASVEEVEVRHVKALMECGGEVTLDVARSILAAHFRTLRATRSAGVRRLAGGYIQCPTCSTPWMADLFRPRIAGCPRKARNERRLRRVLQRSRRQPGKLTKGDKRLLWRFEGRLNMMEVLCHVCGNKKEELFAVPDTEKVEEVVEVEKRRKKKKKKRCKEVNAGLLISSRPVAGNTEESCKSVFTMSEIDTCTPEVPETTLEKRKIALDGAKSSLDMRKKSLKRQKVPLGVFKPRKMVSRVEIKSVPCQPPPAPTPTAKSRERERKVANLKRIMGKEIAKSDLLTGGGKTQNSLTNFLSSLL